MGPGAAAAQVIRHGHRRHQQTDQFQRRHAGKHVWYGSRRGHMPDTPRCPVSVVAGFGGQYLVDVRLPKQESLFVQLLTPHPAGHFGVALAGVARPATRHDVGKRISAAAGDRQHAILLQRSVHRSAVRAAAPRRFQCVPLQIAEVVGRRGDTPSATTGVPGCTRWPSGRHGLTLAWARRLLRLPSGVSTRQVGVGFTLPWLPRNRARSMR